VATFHTPGRVFIVLTKFISVLVSNRVIGNSNNFLLSGLYAAANARNYYACQHVQSQTIMKLEAVFVSQKKSESHIRNQLQFYLVITTSFTLHKT